MDLKDQNPTQTDSKYNLDYISEVLYENITDVLDHFHIDYTEYRTKITMCCPVHQGDNPNGFSILKSGIGNWQCYTHQCHTKYGSSRGASLIKLVQCLLSTDKEFSFYDTIKWIKAFLHLSNDSISEPVYGNRDFLKVARAFETGEEFNTVLLKKETAFQNLAIPSQYFINRGFESETLKFFSVGDCNNSKKQFYQRAVVPLFDDTGDFIIGCTGRSIFERCPKCALWHNNDLRCPMDKFETNRCVKWKHSDKFRAESYYYNVCHAQKFIKKTHTAVIVESPGNTWRLWESGIRNVLAGLGTKFTEKQREILEKLEVYNIILAIDNDDAGRNMAKMVDQDYGRFFNISVIETPYEDFGVTPVNVVQDLFRGII